MPNDPFGQLLSKVNNFTRNAPKELTALDSPESTAPAEGYNRETLKTLIERRQRHDVVRRGEFDMLRKLRQQEPVGAVDAASLPSSFNQSSPEGLDGRAQTLKKIDEIEQQMSQQWWKGGVPPSKPDDRQAKAADLPARVVRIPTPSAPAPTPAYAYADTMPAIAWSTLTDAFMLAGDSAPKSDLDTDTGTAAQPSQPLGDAGIQEAAIYFAGGDDAGSEAVLLQAIAPGSVNADHDGHWRALFDLYRTTGDIKKFERVLRWYEERFSRPGPEWVSFRLLARDMLVATLSGAASQFAARVPVDSWTCPVQLTPDGLGELTRVLAAVGTTCELDWRALNSIDASVAAPLNALFVLWSSSKRQLRFAGGATLLAVLAAATPNNESQIDAVWWELRMSVLRAMNDPDNFESVALSYCRTYEISPPQWSDPDCRYASLDPPSPQGPHSVAMLMGDLRGESLAIGGRLDAELARSGTSSIGCAALLRMDFLAADTLLKWVVAREARGAPVEFIGANRLIAAFFKAIGIAEHATVTVRTD